MTTVTFTSILARHVACPTVETSGGTVREALEGVFVANPRLRGYLVDEQGRLRRHVTVWIDGAPIVDRLALSDAVRPETRLHVVQLLSGG